MKYSILQIIFNKLFAITFFALVFFPHYSFAQEDDQLSLILGALEGGDADLSAGSIEDGYKSFVQNELQNIYTQQSQLTKLEKEEISFAALNKKRIELATELCQKDQRACFLIEEYRFYKAAEELPQNFKELQLYGHDIFAGYSNEFNFFDSLPLSDSYKVKIGDRLKISLFGGFSFESVLDVNMMGSIIIPDIGEFQLAGLTYKEASLKIKEEIGEKYVGTEAYISLDQIRSKQIYALGNVKTPGTYAINAFGSPLNALISAGGVNQNSSLRSIQVLRDNKIIETIDLYDLLINGDVTSSDFLLNDGDSILVNGLKSRASIIGEVIRPAIYEIVDNESLEQLLKFALGATPFADLSNISVERLLPSGQSTIMKPKTTSSFLLRNGDKVIVNSSQGEKINSVAISGALRNAGEYSLEGSNTLGNIIKLQTDLLDNTYIGFAAIKRLNYQSKSYRIIGFDLGSQEALDKINLYSGDRVFIFSHDDIEFMQSKEVSTYLNNNIDKRFGSSSQSIDRNLLLEASLVAQDGSPQGPDSKANSFSNNILSNDGNCLLALDVLAEKPISNLIEARTKLFTANKSRACTKIFHENNDLLPILLINSIPVVGNVRFPGLYPSSSTLNADALFNIAGGFLVSKLNTLPVFEIGIRSRGFGSYNYESLKSLTNITMLNLQLNQASMQTGFVRLAGEFENPGIFEITSDTRLSELFNRAGGLTSQAYPLGGILTRESIQENELSALQRSKAELSEILSSAVASGYLKQNSTDLIGLISLMSSLDDAKAVGRLVTELNPAKIESNPSLDIAVYDGDVIYMPKLLNTVTVVGQVLNPVTVPHKTGANFDYYLKLAGGTKKEADRSKIYVLQPSGVSLRRKNGFKIPVLPFMPFERDDILPGGTLVVPRQARPLDSLALVETVTPILANLSVTAASIAAISKN
ncbi:SLBB domain-containing protein [Gammaproteobacteria bacterium]|nr:SLBB domain-containing protein [Gammaproteobacteria bacterium]